MGGFNFNPSGFYSDDPEDFAGISPDDFADEGANHTRRRDPSQNYDNVGYSTADIERLQEIASRPSPSAAMYEEHLSRRPTREKVSTGRRIAGGLAAAFGEDRLSNDILESPYRQKRQQWEDEGRILSGRARAADSQAAREVGAERFGITHGAIERNRSAAAKRTETAAKATEENRKRIDADRDEQRRLTNEDRDAGRADRKIQAGIANEMREGNKLLRDESAGRAKTDAEARTKDRELKGNKAKVDEIKNRVKEELVNDPHFSDSFEIDKDGRYMFRADMTQEEKKSLKSFIDKRIKHDLSKAGLSNIYDIDEDQ